MLYILSRFIWRCCDHTLCLQLNFAWALGVRRQRIYWVLDNGASYDVSPRRDLLISYRSGDFGYVKITNDSILKAIGVGDVCLDANVDCTLVF